MPRTYDRQQACPIARSLDIVGDRWTLLVLRDLRRGHSKFADLLVSLQGISPTVLSERLQSLEQDGLAARRFYSDHPPRAEYVLTPRGDSLAPVLKALYDWGTEHAPRPPRTTAAR
ncbi:MAG: transcriptional regulator [Dehalococcoidia bacterium]|nr:MAG: transcriptional regulator [Dehalococcoidia bacterium]